MVVEKGRPPPGRGGAAHTKRLALASYCGVCGAVATAVGALASLLVDGVQEKLAVWLVTSAVVAAGAGVVWGLGPVTFRCLAAGHRSASRSRDDLRSSSGR